MTDLTSVTVDGFEAGSVVAVCSLQFAHGTTPNEDNVIGRVQKAVDSGSLDTLGVDKAKKVGKDESNIN